MLLDYLLFTDHLSCTMIALNLISCLTVSHSYVFISLRTWSLKNTMIIIYYIHLINTKILLFHNYTKFIKKTQFNSINEQVLGKIIFSCWRIFRQKWLKSSNFMKFKYTFIFPILYRWRKFITFDSIGTCSIGSVLQVQNYILWVL